jgi:hydrogenase maturation protein HypF
LGVRKRIGFEGQAAMELEMIAKDGFNSNYEYEWKTENIIIILPAPIIRGIVGDMVRRISLDTISAKFHSTLIRLFSDLCEKFRRNTGINRIVMSGGAFQNTILLTGLINYLEKKRFEVFTHSVVPTNDGGICLGQAIVAAARA